MAGQEANHQVSWYVYLIIGVVVWLVVIVAVVRTLYVMKDD